MNAYRNTRRDFLSQSIHFGVGAAAAGPLGKLFAMNSPSGVPGTTLSNTRATRITQIVPDGRAHKFETRNKQFLIDNEPTIIIAGEMHFGRILPEDFETRVKQAKAMGLNEDFVKQLYILIHEDSIRKQTEIMNAEVKAKV